MGARRRPAEPPSGPVGQRSTCRHRSRIRSLVRLRPEPLLSLLRAPASATRPKPGRADGHRIVRPRVYHLPRDAVVRDPRALARHLAGGLRALRTRARRRLRRSPARGRRRTTVFARRPIGDHAIPTKPEPLAQSSTAERETVAAGLTAAGTSPRSRSNVARGSIGARRGLQSDDVD